jgi:hypothetical protein
MTTEVETALPAEVVATEQAANVEQNSTEATTEQTQEGASTTESPEAPKKEPWFQKRIDVLTREKYEVRREADEARQEAAQLREQIARQQQGDETQQPLGNVQTLVQREAEKLVAEQRFNEACNKVYATGKAEFPNFDAAVANLHLVGVGREFLELTAASDAGAKLINHLGTDLDEAARIAALPPLLMARELTKLELKLSQPQAKKVSSAPAPITPVGGTKGSTKDLADPNLSDAEFAELRRKQISQRR